MAVLRSSAPALMRCDARRRELDLHERAFRPLSAPGSVAGRMTILLFVACFFRAV
jgi:hypothetical protein